MIFKTLLKKMKLAEYVGALYKSMSYGLTMFERGNFNCLDKQLRPKGSNFD